MSFPDSSRVGGTIGAPLLALVLAGCSAAPLLALVLAGCSAAPPPEPPPPPPPVIQPIASAPRPPPETPDDELRRKPPEIGKAPPFVSPTVHDEQVKGGIRLLVAERPAIPIVTVQLVFRWGQGAEPGIRTEWLHNFLGGPTALAPEGPRSALLRQGSPVTVEEPMGAGVISFTLDPESLPRALALITSALEKTTTGSSTLARRMSPRLGEVENLAAHARNERLPPGHPFRDNRGEKAPTGKLTTGDLTHFQDSQVAPSMLTVVVAGAVTAAAAREAVEGSLGRWSSKATVKAPATPAAPKSLWIMATRPTKVRQSLMILFSLPTAGRPDLPPVAEDLLLADFLEKLQPQLRNNGMGSVEVVEGVRSPASLDFVVRGTGGQSAAIIAKVRGELQAHAARVRTSPLGAAARRAREMRWNAFLWQLSTAPGLASQITRLALSDHPLGEFASVASLLRASDPDEPLLVDAALPAARLQATILGDPALEQKALSKQKLGTPEAHPPPVP